MSAGSHSAVSLLHLPNVNIQHHPFSSFRKLIASVPCNAASCTWGNKDPRDTFLTILSSPLASFSLIPCSFLVSSVFVPFLNPMRSQESQPTLNYTKLVLKVPCHTWGKKNAFGCSGLVLPTRWLPRNGGSLLLWPWQACLCLPSLILLVLLPLGDILLRIV